MGSAMGQDIKITGASTLSKDDVDRMIRDAEQFAEADRTKREDIDTHNQVSVTTSASTDSMSCGVKCVCEWYDWPCYGPLPLNCIA